MSTSQRDSLSNKQEWDYSTSIQEFFSTIFPDLGYNKEQIDEKLQIAHAREIYNVRALELVKEHLKDYFGDVASGAILKELNTRSTSRVEYQDLPSGLSLYEWIISNDSPVKSFLRTSRAPKRLAHNTVAFKAVFRDNQLKELFGLLSERLEKYDPKDTTSDRFVNTILAMHAPPGGGKSFFLDEVSLVCSDEKSLSDKCPDKKLVDILKDAVMIPITFNGPTPYISTSNVEKNIQMALASRALASYFAAPRLETDFMDVLTMTFPNLVLRNAISCIIEAAQKETNKKSVSVFLLVDEIIKLLTKENITAALTIIGNQLDKGPHQFSALFTTLNMSSLTQSHSGRIFQWIKLPPLPFDQAISLFQKDSTTNLPTFVLQAISDCNGHPRSLEVLGALLNRHQNDLVKLNHQLLMDQLLSSPKLSMYATIPHDLVMLALLGTAVPLTHSVGGFSINDYIEQGYLNNPLTPNDTTVIPEITPLYLALYAKLHFSSSLPEGNLAVMLWRMLMLEPTFDGPRFEAFHAYWEAIIRHCRVYSQTDPTKSIETTLHNFYQITNSNSSPEFKLTAKPKRVIQINQNFPTASIEPPSTENEHFLSEADLKQGVILIGNQNPGYDILVIEPSSKGLLAIAIECKYSEKDSTTKLTADAVNGKYELLVKHWKPHLQGGEYFGKSILGKLGLDESRLWFVFCPWRPMSKTTYAALKQEPWKNILLLNQEQLQKLYSPSLASRPQFRSAIEHSKKLREKAGLIQSLSSIVTNKLPDQTTKRGFGSFHTNRFTMIKGFRW